MKRPRHRQCRLESQGSRELSNRKRHKEQPPCKATDKAFCIAMNLGTTVDTKVDMVGGA